MEAICTYAKHTKAMTNNQDITYIAYCYKMKKCGKRFPYILVKEHYFISLQQEREGM